MDPGDPSTGFMVQGSGLRNQDLRLELQGSNSHTLSHAAVIGIPNDFFVFESSERVAGTAARCTRLAVLQLQQCAPQGLRVLWFRIMFLGLGVQDLGVLC